VKEKAFLISPARLKGATLLFMILPKVHFVGKVKRSRLQLNKSKESNRNIRLRCLKYVCQLLFTTAPYRG